MLVLNTLTQAGAPLVEADARILTAAAAQDAAAFAALHSASGPSPLVSLPGLASNLGISALWLKDEGDRLGLGSFKALGGAYAVARVISEAASRRLGRRIGFGDLDDPAVRTISAETTVTCATDGNHGLSVAQGAVWAGCHAVIFAPERVSVPRLAAISSRGARVVRVDGTYDDAVAAAARASRELGWTLISDIALQEDEQVPRIVMQGYTVLAEECLGQLQERPTHFFVQAGVGGLAAAVAGRFADALGASKPKTIVVEPSRAACLFESARAGRLVGVESGPATIMSMLECYKPSVIAWNILSRLADAFMTVDEADAIRAMRWLAHPVGGDRSVVAGASGAAGLAGLIQIAQSAEERALLELGPEARVLVINSEGASNDALLYRELVGPSMQAGA